MVSSVIQAVNISHYKISYRINCAVLLIDRQIFKGTLSVEGVPLIIALFKKYDQELRNKYN